ncbi:MAG: hypothetical protein SFU98_16965 [Leptospiraceae bacterium]|nr:hypothetical protein [Leptospiraceae bacterium]
MKPLIVILSIFFFLNCPKSEKEKCREDLRLNEINAGTGVYHCLLLRISARPRNFSSLPKEEQEGFDQNFRDNCLILILANKRTMDNCETKSDFIPTIGGS